jgi:rare lipoprotein A
MVAVGIALAAAVALTGYRFAGRNNAAITYIEQGIASWYGPGFHGRKTASGEVFDQNDMTAAHRKLPLGSEVTVTNVETGKSVEVEINDRGPYVGDRRIDLSKAAARKLGILEEGTAKVRIEATDEQLKAAEK